MTRLTESAVEVKTEDALRSSLVKIVALLALDPDHGEENPICGWFLGTIASLAMRTPMHWVGELGGQVVRRPQEPETRAQLGRFMK